MPRQQQLGSIDYCIQRRFVFSRPHKVGLLVVRSHYGRLACDTYGGRGEVPKGFWWENVRETNSGNHSHNRGIILKYIFKT